MTKTFLVLILCTFHSSLVFGDSESSQILDKLNSIEKTISDLSFRIFALEKRLILFEEKILFKENLTLDGPMNTKPRTDMDSDYLEQPLNTFSFSNIIYNDDYNDTLFKGEVLNNSNRSYRYALFKISVFNEKGVVLSSNDFYILNMDKGARRSFEAKLHGIKTHEFVDYTIEFNKGS